MKERIYVIVADVLGIDVVEVTDDSSRETVDSWDSLSHLRIVTALEQEFGIHLTMDEIGDATSVGRLLAVVAKRSWQA